MLWSNNSQCTMLVISKCSFLCEHVSCSLVLVCSWKVGVSRNQNSCMTYSFSSVQMNKMWTKVDFVSGYNTECPLAAENIYFWYTAKFKSIEKKKKKTALWIMWIWIRREKTPDLVLRWLYGIHFQVCMYSKHMCIKFKMRLHKLHSFVSRQAH